MVKPLSTVHIDKGGITYYPVLVVGAGAGGIALGCRLKEKLGFDQFRIFDRQAGIGGVCCRLSRLHCCVHTDGSKARGGSIVTLAW